MIKARDGSLRGTKTIRILKLDASDLLDRYKYHVETHVEPLLQALEERMAATDELGVSQAWEKLNRSLFGPNAPFQALSFDVIDQSLPESRSPDIPPSLFVR